MHCSKVFPLADIWWKLLKHLKMAISNFIISKTISKAESYITHLQNYLKSQNQLFLYWLSCCNFQTATILTVSKLYQWYLIVFIVFSFQFVKTNRRFYIAYPHNGCNLSPSFRNGICQGFMGEWSDPKTNEDATILTLRWVTCLNCLWCIQFSGP